MKKLYLLILFILVVLAVSAYSGESKKPVTASTGSTETIAGYYVVSKSYPLTKGIHGIDGVIQLLQDGRLPKSAYNKHNKQFGSAFNDPNMIDMKLLPLFADNPPLGSVLRILKKNEKFFRISESRTYDLVPVAWLEELPLTGSGPKSFLLTLDESTGMGSYAGPTTYFYDIVDGKLKLIKYLDMTTGKKEDFVLMRSSKTGWKLVKSKDGKTTDILHIACRPDTNNDDIVFLVYYDRFHFDGKQWVKYQRTEKGFWEMENDDLPPLSKFPKSP
jgi:hypothetical protein